MIEWIIGTLFAYWWAYKRKSNRTELTSQKDEKSTKNNEAYKLSFGYLRNDETVEDLV